MCSDSHFPFFMKNTTKDMKKVVTIAILLYLACKTATAVTAYPELIKFVQPDKQTTVKLYLMGDERVHWAETVDGYSLVTNDEGYFVYAVKDAMGNMMPSDFMATDVENRTPQVIRFLEITPKHLRYSRTQIDAMLSLWEVKDNLVAKSRKSPGITGNRKILVILMGFQDKRFIMLRAMVRALFNEVNYVTTGVYGSVHDYYYENSYGQLNLTADVMGPYVCDSNAAYYGRNDNQSVGYQAFATEAILAAAPHVDFSDYDNDGDGVVDCVHILFAGFGEEAGGGADCIWSHKWNLFEPITRNNTTINTYSCSPELGGSFGTTLTKIGVICHEIGHVFGAPDFYDTDYEGTNGQFPGTGKWDLMASGSWNMGGASPAHHNPYTKSEIYKWTELKTLSSPTCVTLQPNSTDSSSFYKLNTTTRGEYYIVENRQQVGFDRGLPGHGMILYHAHADLPRGGGINVGHPQKLYVVSASSHNHIPSGPVASYTGVESQLTPFPGGTLSHILNDTTYPALISWAGDTSGHRLTYIGENTHHNTVSFVYNGGCTPEASTFSGEGISGTKIQLSWTPFGGQKVMIVVNDTNNFSTPQNKIYQIGDTLANGEKVIAYNLFDIRTVCSNLHPNTTYYFHLYTMLDDSTYTTGLACSATTLCANLSFPYNETFQFDPGTTNCWEFINQGDVSWQKDIEGHNLFISLKADSNATVTNGSAFARISPLNLEGNSNLVLLLDVRNILRNDTIDDSTIVPRIDTLLVKYRNETMSQWQTLRMFCNDIPTWQHFSIPLPNTTGDYLIALDGHYGGQTLSVDNVKVTTVHLLSVTTDGHGTVSPGDATNSVAVPDGESITFNITPDNGYQLNEIYVDYELQRRTNPFTINNITEPHVLYVTFKERLAIESPDEPYLKVYPNPASDNVTIALANAAQSEYSFYDMAGREITKGIITADVPARLDLSHLANGVYYIKVVGENFRTTEKIIVTK